VGRKSNKPIDPVQRQLDQANWLLVRLLNAVNKPHWQSGESEAEASFAVRQWLSDQKLEQELSDHAVYGAGEDYD
jgi:hypothetical protein